MLELEAACGPPIHDLARLAIWLLKSHMIIIKAQVSVTRLVFLDAVLC